MQIHHSFQELNPADGTVVTIGMFDGVHSAHRSILQYMSENKGDAQTVLITFDPHPRKVLENGFVPKLLTTLDEKLGLLTQTPLDHVIVQSFTAEFAQLSYEEFITDYLFRKLNMRKIFVGHDHQFGRNREGGFAQIQAMGKKLGFSAEQIPEIKHKGVVVSSTKIRRALESGDILTANDFLGYPYFLSGTVISGDGIGKTLGFPTMNLQIPARKLIPAKGVYGIQTTINGTVHRGLMNTGMRPTVNGTENRNEVYLFDFSENMYHREVKVELLCRIRDEQKFGSRDELIAQIRKDEEIFRAFKC